MLFYKLWRHWVSFFAGGGAMMAGMERLDSSGKLVAALAAFAIIGGSAVLVHASLTIMVEVCNELGRAYEAETERNHVRTKRD